MVAVSEDFFKIEQNDSVGRYAVATKALKAGEPVFEEHPFVVGPKPNTIVVCLECCSTVDGTASGSRCAKCSWPLCESCKVNTTLPNHSGECEIFQQNKVKFFNLPTPHEECLQLECITPLRVLLQKEKDPKRWESEISKMEYHPEIRKNCEVYKADSVNVVGYLHGPCKLKDRFSEELINQACGILDVNSFEAKTAKGNKIRGIFPKAAILAHSCVPNTTHIILPSKDFKLTLRTTVNVKQGEQLFTTYTYTLSGTQKRQEMLSKGKFFSCSCERCLDPTELNTHFSSVMCQKCEGGVTVSTKPLEKSADWKCSKCGFVTPSTAIDEVIGTIEGEINALQELETSIENIGLCEEVLKKYQKILHPNHYLMVNLKENLIDMYGWQLGNKIDEEAAVNHCLDRKIALCREVLTVLDVIQPGMNRARAMLVYEIYTSLGAIIKKNWSSVPNRGQHIDGAKRLLNECLTIFEWEDETSLEFYLADICRKISHELQSLQEFKLDD